MDQMKRRRGRPAGTDYKDGPALALVADRLLAEPDLKPMTAMGQVYDAGKWRDQSRDATIARWARKWRTVGTEMIENALTRRNSSAAASAQDWQATYHRRSNSMDVMGTAVALNALQLGPEALQTFRTLSAQADALRRATEASGLLALSEKILGLQNAPLAQQMRRLQEHFAKHPNRIVASVPKFR